MSDTVPKHYSDIVESYEEYVDLQKNKYYSSEREVDLWSEGQTRYIKENFANVEKDKKIIDIACGDGVGLSEFKKLGFQSVEGVEFNEKKYNLAISLGLKVHCLDMHDLSFLEDNSYDIIYSSHTLEHAYYPSVVMKEFHRILKKDGLLYIVLPYPESPNMFQECHGGKYEMGGHIKDDAVSLINFFKKNKFELISKKYDHFRQDEVWMVLSRVL